MDHERGWKMCWTGGIRKMPLKLGWMLGLHSRGGRGGRERERERKRERKTDRQTD